MKVVFSMYFPAANQTQVISIQFSKCFNYLNWLSIHLRFSGPSDKIVQQAAAQAYTHMRVDTTRQVDFEIRTIALDTEVERRGRQQLLWRVHKIFFLVRMARVRITVWTGGVYNQVTLH